VAVKDPTRPVDTSAGRAEELEQRIVELKRARTSYPEHDGAARRGRGAGRASSGGRVTSAVRHRRDAFLRRWEVRRD
jgi:hypothetical protein